jgi:RHS repeat-associated protein
MNRIVGHLGPLRVALAIVAISVFAPWVQGQQDAISAQGLTPYGSFHGGDIDSISIVNGKVNLHIPLISYPQTGGKLHAGFLISFGNALFTKQVIVVPRQPNETVWSFSSTGVQIASDFTAGVSEVLNQTTNQYFAHTPDGSSHEMQATSDGLLSLDATGFHYNPTTEVLIDRDGVSYSINTNLIEDSNGNSISFAGTGSAASWTDTLGRVIPMPPNEYGGGTSTTDFTYCGGSLPITAAYLWSLPTVGGTATYKICVAKVPISYPTSGCTPTIHCYPVNGSFPLIQSIVLPNNTAWSFAYDSLGDLTQVIFPTGGTITYSGWQFLSFCSGSNTSAYYRGGVTSRSINANDGTGTHTWTYSSDNGQGGVVTVTDPQGNTTLHTMSALSGSTCAYYETLTKYYQGSTTLLKTVTTSYMSNLNPFNGQTAINVVPTTVTTAWANGKTSEIAKSYDSGTPLTSYSFNILYGDVTQEVDYDYGSGAPGSPLKTTTTSYLALNNSAYLTANLLTLPSQVSVFSGGTAGTGACGANGAIACTTYGYDESPSPSGAHGNQTSVNRWLNTTGTSLKTSAVYNSNGTTQSSTDPKLNVTKYLYVSPGYAGSGPTSMTNALNQTTSYLYDFNSGLLTSITDPNLQPTTFTYDSMWRVASISYPDTGLDTITHQESSFPFTATLTKRITPSLNYVMTNTFDGLGRVSQSEIASDPDGPTYTATVYDALGRKGTVYNPTRCNPPTANCGEATWGYTTYAYDALNRTTLVTEPDGGTIKTAYCGSTTLVTDEANHWRRTTSDGLGRMIEADEPNSLTASVNANGCVGTGDPIWPTNYAYDPLNNLTSVSQSSSRPRSFAYDSLSRLTSSTNPETGSATYTYDNNGNVLSKVSPEVNQTNPAVKQTVSYQYDALNRILQKSYNGVQQTAFLYDTANTNGVTLSNTIGRLSVHDTAVVESLFSYDPVGRVITLDETTPQHNSGAFSLGYIYDLMGDITSFTNGLGVTFSYAIDGAGRTKQITSSLSNPPQYPGTLVTVDPTLGFYPNGAIRKMTYGEGLTETSAYNTRLQPCRMNVNSSGTVLNTCTDTIPSGSVQDFNYGFAYGAGDNGNITSWVATGQQDFSRSYSYDQVNRLLSMNDSASNQACKGLSWTYDSWANRTAQTVTSGYCPSPLTPVNSNNQLMGYAYDAAGNMTSDGSHTYTYDPENNLLQVDGGSTNYVYDAVGHRVEKNYAGGYVDYLYDLAGNVEGEWNIGPNAHYIYMDGRLVAEYIANTTYFVHKDHLGSTRLITHVDQSLVDNMDYLPYGEQIAGASAISHKFTGKERDSESGLDNFEARYDSSSLGRFMSPDPPSLVGLPVDSQDPQSWNAYAYVRNNPLNLSDPDGTVFCRAANDAEKNQGVTQVCDVTDAQYVNSSEEGRAAYDKAGYKHFDCSCDSGADKDAWQHPNGNAGKDYVGYALVFVASLAIVREVTSYFANETEEEEGVVIGKVNPDGTLRDTTLKPGERQLELLNQGNPKANWAQNSSKLREAMRDGEPIRDGSAGVPGSESGFLRAERNLLRDRGWELKGGSWYPPNK